MSTDWCKCGMGRELQNYCYKRELTIDIYKWFDMN